MAMWVIPRWPVVFEHPTVAGVPTGRGGAWALRVSGRRHLAAGGTHLPISSAAAAGGMVPCFGDGGDGGEVVGGEW